MQLKGIDKLIGLEESNVQVYNIIRFYSKDAALQYEEIKELLSNGKHYHNDDMDLFVLDNEYFLRFVHLLENKHLYLQMDILRLNTDYWEITLYKCNRAIQQTSKSFRILKSILDSGDIFVRLNFGALQSLAHDKTDIDELTVVKDFIKAIMGNDGRITLGDLTVRHLAYVSLLYELEPEDVMDVLDTWNNYNCLDEKLPIVPLLNIKDYEDYYYEFMDINPLILDQKIEFQEEDNFILREYRYLLINTINPKYLRVVIDSASEEDIENNKRKYSRLLNSLTFPVRLAEEKTENTLKKVFFYWTSRGHEIDLERFREIESLIPNSYILVERND